MVDKNQLNLLREFDATEQPIVPENPETSLTPAQNKESAADKAIREINEKLEAAKARQKRVEDNKWAEDNLRKVRDQFISTEAKEAPELIEEKVLAGYEDVEPDKPAEEYYGRWNQFRKKKK